MKTSLWALLPLALAGSVVVAVSPRASRIDDQETTTRTLQWTPATDSRVLEVSNVSGSIRVEAGERSDVEMVAVRTIRAESADLVKEAKERIRLDVAQEAATLRICGDSEHCGCERAYLTSGSWRDGRYRVDVSFELRVPRRLTLKLCTINGRLSVEGTDGEFDLRGVNGAVQMADVRGAGRAETVNGAVTLSFAANPSGASSFKTVNGRLEAAFPSDLAADLRLKTFNGGLYTDFDVSPLPARPIAEARRGKLVYRSDQFAAVRVGAGGPELTFESFNGDVRVVTRKK
jgi:hypothetical protein